MGSIIKSMLQKKFLYFRFTSGYLKTSTASSHNLRMRFQKVKNVGG